MLTAAHHLSSSRSPSTSAPRLLPQQRPNLLLVPARLPTSPTPQRRWCCAASFEPGSLEYLRQQQRLQSRSPSLRSQGPQQLPGEETDLLWAGYSALEEQVQKHHKRHEALHAQIAELQAKLAAVHQQQQQQQPGTVWQAASFLLFFLVFINFWGMIANLSHFTAGAMGWLAPQAPASGLWLKQLLGFAVPLTNTAVILIFCLQAVKAAWSCLRF